MEPRLLVLWTFVIVMLLTALAVLAAALGVAPAAAPELTKWGIPTLLGEVVATLVLFFKAQWGQLIQVNLAFEDSDPDEVEFEREHARFRVMDRSGLEVSKGSLGPVLDHGGWQVQIPVTVQQGHSLSFELRTTDGQDWVVHPFRPGVHTRTALKAGG